MSGDAYVQSVIDFVPRGQRPQLVKSANLVTLVGGIRNSVTEI